MSNHFKNYLTGEGNSFYIPAVGNVTQQQIAQAFWVGNVGEVSRVDYFENSTGLWCAFVHFYSLYKNNVVFEILNSIERRGSYKMWINDREYLILRKMTCAAVPETSMNIHQIAAKLEEQEGVIERLQETVSALEAKISGRVRSHTRWVYDRDEEMEQMVTSLVGPRFTEEDDVDASDPVFVGFSESKSDDSDYTQMLSDVGL